MHFHLPESPALGLVLTHGAGSNCEAPLLVAVAREMEGLGIAVLRFDLAFRKSRPKGPPWPASAESDRASIAEAAAALRTRAGTDVWAGGHSYGGRQASMLLASEPGAAAGLLSLSYPLHPPGKPEQLRTAHLPSLAAPALFVSGTEDPFGTPDELRSAVAMARARTELRLVQGAGHDLAVRGRPRREIASEIAEAFAVFAGLIPSEPVVVPVTDVFDLHTVNPADAKAVLEAYLEEAHRLGLKALRIVHGRGIGVQREMVRTLLARTPFVASFSDAPAEAGGWGATVVTLR